MTEEQKRDAICGELLGIPANGWAEMPAKRVLDKYDAEILTVGTLDNDDAGETVAVTYAVYNAAQNREDGIRALCKSTEENPVCPREPMFLILW